MYIVIKHFTDLHDNDHPYNVGDIFPREGVEVKQNRLDELAGSANKQGEPLIKKIDLPNAKAKSAPAKDKPKRESAKKPGENTSGE